MRGEKWITVSGSTTLAGSPPLARGKGQGLGLIVGGLGITPACAGKSDFPAPEAVPALDHPRLRGEKHQYENYDNIEVGSPPLARGKVHSLQAATNQIRITPACAGKRQR